MKKLIKKILGYFKKEEPIELTETEKQIIKLEKRLASLVLSKKKKQIRITSRKSWNRNLI